MPVAGQNVPVAGHWPGVSTDSLLTHNFYLDLERPFRGSKRRGGEDSCGGI